MDNIDKSRTNITGQIKVLERAEYREKNLFPVSSSQKRMFILNQFSAEDTGYNTTAAWIIKGTVDKERFGRVFKELSKRHEALRTSFEIYDNEVVQRIHNEAEIPIVHREGSEEETDSIMEDFIKPFDLMAAPLMRVQITRLKCGCHLMHIDMHHIISDAISLRIILEEIALLYQGKELPMPEVQYRDYAVWQNKLIETQAIKRQEKYWLEVFAQNHQKGQLHPLDTMLDYPRSAIKNYQGEYVLFKAGVKLTEELKRLSSELETTLYAVMLAAYNILLSKYTGQEDIIVGSPVAGRNHAGLERIIGVFINTLPVRSYLPGDKRVEDFIKDVGYNIFKALDNQDYPLDKLVDALNIERDFSRNPLFDTIFNMTEVDLSGANTGDIEFDYYTFITKTALFDIVLEAEDCGGEIDFILLYDKKLFKRSTAEKLANSYVKVLEAVAANKSAKIEELRLSVK